MTGGPRIVFINFDVHLKRPAPVLKTRGGGLKTPTAIDRRPVFLALGRRLFEHRMWKGAREGPRRAPGSPRGLPRGPQDSPKMGPRGPREGPRSPPKGPRWLQVDMILKAPAPEGPKTARRGPKEAPRRPEGRQEGPKITPKRAQDGPKMAQDGAKMASQRSRQTKMKRKIC